MKNETTNEAVDQYLTFKLGNELFGVDVSKAREVLDSAQVTRVPQAPDYMLGVINLRGAVVPVIDMNRKFGMAATEQSLDSCIIVIEVKVDGETLVIGSMADAVQEVLDISRDQIEPPPRLGTRLNTEFIKGMGNVNDEFVIILDIDRVFTAEEITEIGGNQPQENEGTAD